MGEQPGRSAPHFLTDWHSLPKGCFIATNKFATTQPAGNSPFPVLNVPPFSRGSFPFPFSTNVFVAGPPTGQGLPYIAFDYLGRLALQQTGAPSQKDEYIPLALGSIFYGQTAAGGYDLAAPADVLETPVGNSINVSNVIHIDGLTGRARIERQEVQ